MVGLLRCACAVLVLSMTLLGCGPGRSIFDSEGLESNTGPLSMAITGSYLLPDEGAAFGIPGTPPATTTKALLAAQAVERLSGGGAVTKQGSSSRRGMSRALY